MPGNQIPPPSKVSSTLKPLLDELNRIALPHQSEPNSRKVSFSSIGTPQGKLSVERIRSGSHKSPLLRSVQEGVSEVQGDDKRSGSGSRSEFNTPKISVTGSEDGKKSREFHHSTPTQSSITSSANHKRSKRYIDHDMQTEIGSHHGDQDEDSGNEADVETCLDNLSPFPGCLSRISMAGGPLTKEQVQRNQAKMMAEHLVQAALLAGAKDNVSVMVVLLPGCGL